MGLTQSETWKGPKITIYSSGYKKLSFQRFSGMFVYQEYLYIKLVNKFIQHNIVIHESSFFFP